MHSPHNPDNDFKQDWCRRRKQKDISAREAPAGPFSTRFNRKASGAARAPAIRYSVAASAALSDGFMCRLNWQALWHLPVALAARI
jgi:hypothetical protein